MIALPHRLVIVSPEANEYWENNLLKPNELESLRASLCVDQVGRRVKKFAWLPWTDQPAGVYVLPYGTANRFGKTVMSKITIFDFGRKAASIVSIHDAENAPQQSELLSSVVQDEARLLLREITKALLVK